MRLVGLLVLQTTNLCMLCHLKSICQMTAVQNKKLSCRRRSAHNRMISLLNTAQMFSELYLKRLAVAEYTLIVYVTRSQFQYNS